MYITIGNMLAGQGKTFVSSSARSEAADGLWASLERTGFAKKIALTPGTGKPFYEYVPGNDSVVIESLGDDSALRGK